MMTTHIVDDFAAIALRLKQLENKTDRMVAPENIDPTVDGHYTPRTSLLGKYKSGDGCISCGQGFLRAVTSVWGVTLECDYCHIQIRN